MSSNQRPQSNVGVGTLREADEIEYSVNEGWDLFQKHLPDDSVIDSEPFSFNADPLTGDGPYIINIPKYPDCFLDPASLRLNGTMKIIYKKNNNKQDKLPKMDANPVNPEHGKIFQIVELTDATKLAAAAAKETDELMKDNIIPLYNKAKDNTKYFVMEYARDRWPGDVAKVSPVNMMCQAMWRDIEIKMNGIVVTKNANLEYPYKAMFETLLTYSPDALETHMQSEMWAPDDYEERAHYDKTVGLDWDADYQKTKSFLRKQSKYCQNNEFDFSMQLHT